MDTAFDYARRHRRFCAFTCNGEDKGGFVAFVVPQGLILRSAGHSNEISTMMCFPNLQKLSFDWEKHQVFFSAPSSVGKKKLSVELRFAGNPEAMSLFAAMLAFMVPPSFDSSSFTNEEAELFRDRFNMMDDNDQDGGEGEGEGRRKGRRGQAKKRTGQGLQVVEKAGDDGLSANKRRKIVSEATISTSEDDSDTSG